MKEKRSSRILTAILIAGAAIAAPLLAQTGGEQFTATVANPVGGGTSPVMIHIDHYSTDEQVETLKGILGDKGPDALRDELWDFEAGYIRVGGGLGYPIAVARSRPAENGGRVIRLMMDRPIAFWESANNTRSTDYPFGYIEINLDSTGKGEGRFFAAAKVTMTAGTVDIESYSPQPLRLLGVQKR